MPFPGHIDPSDNPTVTINGVDYTAYLIGNGRAIDVQQTLPTIPRADERRAKFEPLLAIGTIELFADQERLVIDWEAAIPNFKEGRQVVITTRHNTYNFRVRNWDITEQDACTGTIRGVTVNLTDKLGLINRQTKRPPLFEYLALRQSLGIPTSQIFNLWQQTIQLVGQFPKKADDQPYLTAADFNLPTDNFTDNGFLDTERLPDGEFNAAEAIASILFARGYGCYCDPADEIIKGAPINLDVGSIAPDYRWDCRQLISLSVSRGTEEPVDRVEASVQSVKRWFSILRPSVDVTEELPPDTIAIDVADPNAVSVETWPKTFPINMNGDEIRATRTEQRPNIRESVATYSYSESGQKSALFPGNPDNTFINYLTGTLERKSHPRYKFPVSEIRTEQVAKGVLSKDIFPESEVKAGRRVERRWKVSNFGDGGDGILTHEYEQLWLPRSVVLQDETLADDLVIQSEQGDRYQEYSPGQWARYPYRIIADLDNLSTNLIPDPDFDGTAEFLDGVPAPPVHPEEEPETIETNTAEANAESGGDSGGPILIVRLNFGNRADLARTTADISLALSQWNRIVYDVRRTEQPADRWRPYAREDAANAGMIKVGYVLQYITSEEDGNSLEYGYTGLKAVSLEKPITIEDADAGQLPSETNVTPVYRAIERLRAASSFRGLSASASIIAEDAVFATGQFAALGATAKILEPGTIAASGTFSPLQGTAQVLKEESVDANGMFAALQGTALISDSDADAQAYIARLSGTYSNAEQVAINDFVVALKGRTTVQSITMWNSLDVIVLTAADNSTDAVLNIKENLRNGTQNGTLTFVARQGFTGDTSTGYIATALVGSGTGADFFGAYTRTTPTDGSLFGSVSGANSYLRLRVASGSTSQARVKTGLGTGIAGVTSWPGAHTISQRGDSFGLHTQNQTSIGTTTAAIVDNDAEMFVLADNDILNGTRLYSDAQIAAYWGGNHHWDDADIKFFHAQIETLLDVFGAGVVT